jgi:hypothetical protein
MTTATISTIDLARVRIAALLDRLDPRPDVCAVPGCQHLHEHGYEQEPSPRAA